MLTRIEILVREYRQALFMSWVKRPDCPVSDDVVEAWKALRAVLSEEACQQLHMDLQTEWVKARLALGFGAEAEDSEIRVPLLDMMKKSS